MKQLSRSAWALWAKKDKPGSMGWLPLPQHLADAAHIGRLLWGQWLSPRLRHRISSGWSGQDEAERLLVFLLTSHDVAKATPVFQSKSRAFPMDDLDQQLLEHLRASGLPCEEASAFMNARLAHHAFAGQQILESLGCPPAVAGIIGAHHGKPATMDDYRNKAMSSYAFHYHMGAPGKAPWKAVQKEIVDFALRLSGFERLEDLPLPSMEAQVLLCGLVIMGDWIASNAYLFPYVTWGGQVREDQDGARAQAAWARLRLPEGWLQDPFHFDDDLFFNRFQIASPYPAQRDVVQIASGTVRPGIMVIEAPMGSGKTEAALAAAEILAQKTDATGLLFALPTQATSNAMFSRILSWALALPAHGRTAVRLAHGKAQFNDDYASLLEGSHGVGEEDQDTIVHQWFEGNKKSLLADFVVGTIDQFLMAGLKQKHVMLRHLGLAGKVVILDECHAYDAYMNCYLDRVLLWMGAYGVPVIVLSATLPASRRVQMISAYLGRSLAPPPQRNMPGQARVQVPERPAWAVSQGYPLITWTDGKQINQREVDDAGQERSVRIERLPEEQLTSRLGSLLAEGGYAGVVVNTVDKAQRVAARLMEIFGEDSVTLVHARFILPDRAKTEEKLLRMLGRPKEGETRRGTHIVVGTQVIEQSLDLDFDVLITELCPMDLLLQRMGRLHRHGRGRPAALTQPLCLIMGAEEGALDPGAKAVYQAYPLLRTKAFLPPDCVTLPRDIPALVQSVYDEEVALPCEPDGYDQAKRDWCIAIARRERAAATYLLGKPSMGSTLLDWMANLPGDALGEAAVRDGSDTLEVLVIMRHADNTYSPLPWLAWGNAGAEEGRRRFSGGEAPDADSAKMFARQSLRLPPKLCYPPNISATVKALEASNQCISAWQESPWLRGQLFLILDEALEASLCGVSLVYHRRMGLMDRSGERGNT